MNEMGKYPNEFEQILIHTGQHYDTNMSQLFFNELELSKPNVNLGVGSGTHAWQTAQIMQRFEGVVLEYKPDWVVVPGDVNSTLACALVASKLGVKVAHVEAGLRSFDRTMPEEINRVLTDHLADMLFTTEQSGNDNLQREGIPSEKIHFVGNTMIDTLVRLLPKTQGRWPDMCRRFGLTPNQRYILVTLHRPSNVDNPATLREIMKALYEVGREARVIFPVHPRTRHRIVALELDVPNMQSFNVQLVEPFGYLDFLTLEARASLVLTDSGGIQEETTYLGVPCLTVRPNTERPITVTKGTNRLVSNDEAALIKAVQEAPYGHRGEFKTPAHRPELWDGHAAARIVKAFIQV